MKVVVRQISGLGNQLFQYAAGRFYAKRYDAALSMVIDPEEGAFSHGHPRPFLLSQFEITAPVSTLSTLDRILLSRKGWLHPARRVLGVQVLTEARHYHFAPSLEFKADLRALYLVGYWQTWRMVESVARELRAEFQFRQPAEGKNLETIEKIRRCSMPVSLHVRRGDFTLAAEGRIALPMDYYLRAIQVFKDRFGDPTFFVFSDDMGYVKEHLEGRIRAVFVENNDFYHSHEDLRLMSACRHHIVANSTFSWWGAWLNPDAAKVVVAPRHWLLRENSYFPELMGPDWVLLDTRRQEGSHDSV